MGQGAMHDNLILPVEPVGTLGAKPNVDLGNLPVMLAPTEIFRRWYPRINLLLDQLLKKLLVTTTVNH